MWPLPTVLLSLALPDHVSSGHSLLPTWLAKWLCKELWVLDKGVPAPLTLPSSMARHAACHCSIVDNTALDDQGGRYTGLWVTHQEHDDDAHEDALQVAQALHALQQCRCAPKERILPCLLHYEAHAPISAHIPCFTTRQTLPDLFILSRRPWRSDDEHAEQVHLKEYIYPHLADLLCPIYHVRLSLLCVHT